MAVPLISILIPVYNAGPWLAATVQSALAQTWENTEIILVDDASTDGSREVAKGFAGPRVKTLVQQKKGQSAALNLAMREAQGEYFEFLDADDLLAPTKLARQMSILRECDGTWLATGAWRRFRHEPAETVFVEEPIWRDLSPSDWLITSWSGGGMMHGAAWLIPRVVANRAGGWAEDLSLVNDFEYFSRLVLSSSGVKFCREAESYYRSGHAGSLSGAKSPQAWLSAFRSFERGTKHLLAQDDSPRARAAAARTFQSFAYAAYPTVPDLVDKALSRVVELGGSDYKLRAGRAFNFICAVAGWKAARRIQHFYHHLSPRKN